MRCIRFWSSSELTVRLRKKSTDANVREERWFEADNYESTILKVTVFVGQSCCICWLTHNHKHTQSMIVKYLERWSIVASMHLKDIIILTIDQMAIFCVDTIRMIGPHGPTICKNTTRDIFSGCAYVEFNESIVTDGFHFESEHTRFFFLKYTFLIDYIIFLSKYTIHLFL